MADQELLVPLDTLVIPDLAEVVVVVQALLGTLDIQELPVIPVPLVTPAILALLVAGVAELALRATQGILALPVGVQVSLVPRATQDTLVIQALGLLGQLGLQVLQVQPATLVTPVILGLQV